MLKIASDFAQQIVFFIVINTIVCKCKNMLNYLRVYFIFDVMILAYILRRIKYVWEING